MKPLLKKPSREVQREIDRILSRPYAHELVREYDGSWFARIVELPGCMTAGATQEEALVNLRDGAQAWLYVALADGNPIPEPLMDTEYSGRFVVRVPRSLHRDLARAAELEDVSLNQYVLMKLAK